MHITIDAPFIFGVVFDLYKLFFICLYVTKFMNIIYYVNVF